MPIRFGLPGFRGEAAPALSGEDLPALARRLLDPASATETLHWGRNYLYRVRLEREGAPPLDLAVKQFRNDAPLARLRRRFGAGKGERAWRMSRALTETGIPTPEPLLFLDAEKPAGPSLVATRFVAGATELRYLLRARNAGREREEFPGIDGAATLEAVARLARALHDAGFVYRDLSVGNVLLVCGEADGGVPQLVLVDVNRCRRRSPGDRVSLAARMRDFSRLPLAADDRRRFLVAYFGAPPRTLASGLARAARAGFVLRTRAKASLRGVARGATAWILPRRAHPHLPPPAEQAGPRDRIVWDRLSDQPHQHAGRLARAWIRLADLPDHLATAAAVARATPRVLRRFRALGRAAAAPVPWPGAGVALRPPADGELEPLLAGFDALGLARALVRVHLWEPDDVARAATLAAALARRPGVEITFALAQSRALVADPAALRRAVEAAARALVQFGKRFQLGQAINRSKWGFWNYGEYLRFVAEAAEILRGAGEVLLAGPAAIDFEPYAWMGALDRRSRARFDAVAALLYVDRRGAPENRQLGLDTVGKIRLLRAVAETAPSVAAPGLWITEVNWPLAEGPHSPAGRSVAVSEATQADYLARYFVAAFATGWVERIFWWRLAAKGYGLIDPAPATGEGARGEGRRRPAFAALAALESAARGATIRGPLRGTPPSVRMYHLAQVDGGETIVGWTTRDRERVALARPVAAAHGVAGEPLATPASDRVELVASPRYFRLV